MLALPRAARVVNDAMAAYTVHRLETYAGPLAGKVVLVLGVAYRGDVRETAFTSAKLLQKALIERGAFVCADDPLFSYDELLALGYAPLAPGRSGEVEAIVLQADHQAYRQFDFSLFQRCRVVLDGRRALRIEQREQLRALGIRYMAVGDGGQANLRSEGEGQVSIASAARNGGER
jgi:UDP-N-acetyl-D-mannosaminuronate dehydrogenase